MTFQNTIQTMCPHGYWPPLCKVCGPKLGPTPETLTDDVVAAPRFRAVTESHFVVEYSAKAARGWRQNYQLDAICATAKRAIEMLEAHETREDVRVHSVRRAGAGTTLLLDESVTA